MIEFTRGNDYKPTAAEKRLLEVLINPNNLGKSITHICELANISRRKYYDAIKKDDFNNLVNKITMDILKNKASNVLNATYKYSLEEKGHQDRKMLLNILGVYTDKQEIKHEDNTTKNIHNMTDEEKQKRIEELRKKFKDL